MRIMVVLVKRQIYIYPIGYESWNFRCKIHNCAIQIYRWLCGDESYRNWTLRNLKSRRTETKINRAVVLGKMFGARSPITLIMNSSYRHVVVYLC